MRRNDRVFFIIYVFIGYYIAWILPRLSAIIFNTLHFDDFLGFLTINHPLDTIFQGRICSIPPADYRWFGHAVGCALGLFLPTWSIAVLPKLVAGIFVSAVGIMFLRFLIRLAVPRIIAILIPLVFIFHPIVNELTLWNSTAFFLLWLGLCIGAYLIIGSDRSPWQNAAGILLLMLAVLAYEIYFVIFLVFLLAEPVFLSVSKQPISRADIRRKISIFIAVSLFYLGQVIITRLIFGPVAGRGLVVINSVSAYFDEKFHGIINLIVNTYMPLVSYYSGLEVAWSAWKWLPLFVTATTLVFGFLLRRSWWDAFGLAGFSLILPVVPTLPVFLMSQSPESWRVSIPVLLAVCLTLALMATLIWKAADQIPAHWVLLQRLTKGLALTALGALLLIEIPVTFAEAQLRVFENRADQTLMEAVEGFWSAQGLERSQYRVGVIGNLGLPGAKPDLQARARRISVSYHARGLSSGLDHDFSWRGMLVLHGFHIVELDDKDINTAKGCEQRPQFCRLELRDELARRCIDHPDFINPANGWRLVHDMDQKITAICR